VRVPAPSHPPAPAVWLALGDSYTVGEGLEAREAWPERTADRLRAAGTPVGPLHVFARTGWTTDELLAAMDDAGVWPPRERFALVTLLIGVNDQYRGHDPRAFAERYTTCLDRAVALAGGLAARVLAVSIPDWGVTPFAEGRDRGAIARALDEYNAVVRSSARARGVHWADVTARSRAHPDVVADGLHPAASVHEAWSADLAPAVRRALAGEAPQS